jgi:hypothetical protein
LPKITANAVAKIAARAGWLVSFLGTNAFFVRSDAGHESELPTTSTIDATKQTLWLVKANKFARNFNCATAASSSPTTNSAILVLATVAGDQFTSRGETADDEQNLGFDGYGASFAKFTSARRNLHPRKLRDAGQLSRTLLLRAC